MVETTEAADADRVAEAEAEYHDTMGYDSTRYETETPAAPAVADSLEGESARLAGADDPDALGDTERGERRGRHRPAPVPPRRPPSADLARDGLTSRCLRAPSWAKLPAGRGPVTPPAPATIGHPRLGEDNAPPAAATLVTAVPLTAPPLRRPVRRGRPGHHRPVHRAVGHLDRAAVRPGQRRPGGGNGPQVCAAVEQASSAAVRTYVEELGKMIAAVGANDSTGRKPPGNGPSRR